MLMQPPQLNVVVTKTGTGGLIGRRSRYDGLPPDGKTSSCENWQLIYSSFLTWA